jgi:beta-lactamase regulating signal transducer with metallopeptidase domain
MNLTAIFQGALEASWQASLVIVLILLLRPLLGFRVPARWRPLLWMLALVRLLVPAFLLPPNPASLQNLPVANRPLAHVEQALGKSSTNPVPARGASPAMLDVEEGIDASAPGSPIRYATPQNWWGLAAKVWLGGACLFAVWLLGGAMNLRRRVARGASDIDPGVAAIWLACCRKVPVRRPPRLVVTDAVASPALVGIIRPSLLLPRHTGVTLSRKDQEHIFLHELAHYRRRDHWTHFLQLLALCVHWFNPLVWLGFRYLRTDREMAADEWVLRRLEDRRIVSYGETLLKVLAGQTPRGMHPYLVGIVEDGAQIRLRLRHVVAFGHRRASASFLGMTIVLVMAAIVLGRQIDRTWIRDRNGLALVELGAAGERPRFPLNAVGAQFLATLAGDAEKNPPEAKLDLTIDGRIQCIAERILRGVPRGAAVVVDPRNGDILALASVPSFDPNTLTAEARAKLASDETQPLSNRCLSEAAPGSTFLVVTALAGARKGLSAAKFTCAGGVQYGAKLMKCWVSGQQVPPHGALTLDEAMKVSCGAFFFQYGNATGISNIMETGKALGLGQPSGLSLSGEQIGLVPGPDWLRTAYPSERWSSGYTANASIGQGPVTATPLQMAMVAAAIGNGGQSYFPRLRMGEPVRLRADLLKEGWSGEGIEIVRRGMWKCVNEAGGTGRSARVEGLEVAGKSGSVQSWRQQGGEQVKDTHGWFIAFAPFENPKYAVCVVVQGARSGGGVAAPIAGRILAEALAPGSAGRVEALAPAKGSFEPVDRIEGPQR